MTAQAIPGEAYLYLVEFIGHGVKVGISVNPSRRLRQHRSDAEAYGHTIGRTWVALTACGNARANERAIKGPARREYLARSFDECLAQALSLPMERLDPAEVASRSAAITRTLQSIVMGR